MKWEHRPPAAVEIALIMALTLAIIITATVASVRAEEYVMPRIPTEKEKTEALQLGYILNGFSMKRHPSDGSIDVSRGFEPTSMSPPPGVVRTIPIVPPKKKDRDK